MNSPLIYNLTYSVSGNTAVGLISFKLFQSSNEAFILIRGKSKYIANKCQSSSLLSPNNDFSSPNSAIRIINNTKSEVIDAFVGSTSIYNGGDGNLTAKNEVHIAITVTGDDSSNYIQWG